jgi:hypothetical protein
MEVAVVNRYILYSLDKECTHKGQHFCITVVIYSYGNSTLFHCAKLAPCYRYETCIPNWRVYKVSHVTTQDLAGTMQLCWFLPAFCCWRGVSCLQWSLHVQACRWDCSKTKGSNCCIIGCDIRRENLVWFTIGVCLVNSEAFLTTDLRVLNKFYLFIKLLD